MNYPIEIFFTALIPLWASAWLGGTLGKRRKADGESNQAEYGLVLSATLTLLGLLIGFSFSMAIGRYDQRKNYEEEEANAIGTEYVRSDLLRDPVRVRVQQQLVSYLDLRIRRYEAHASRDTQELSSKTAQLQREMWDEVRNAAASDPSPIVATVVTGMNDVLNSQGYTQAARLNRIPLPAWGLMAIMALFCNFLVGYGAKRPHGARFLILPMSIAVSFMLIADIDSPQGGLIRVAPQNLIMLADSLNAK